VLLFLLIFTFQWAPTCYGQEKEEYQFTDTRISEGNNMIKKKQFQQAVEAFEEAQASYEEEQFGEGIVYANIRKSYALKRWKKWDRAKSTAYTSIALAKQWLPAKHDIPAKAYNEMGLFYYE